MDESYPLGINFLHPAASARLRDLEQPSTARSPLPLLVQGGTGRSLPVLPQTDSADRRPRAARRRRGQQPAGDRVVLFQPWSAGRAAGRIDDRRS